MSNTLLRVYPSELKIPFELKKQRSCCMQLMNRTDQYVAFKVKTTNPRKYSVRHTFGILLPRSSCSVTVTMQAPLEMVSDYHCKDKFLVQSVVVRDAATTKELVPQLFIKAPGKVIEEFKLRVVYIAANPPSPVPEEAEEEGSSPRSEVKVSRPSVCDVAPTDTRISGEEPSCAETPTDTGVPRKGLSYAVVNLYSLWQTFLNLPLAPRYPFWYHVIVRIAVQYFYCQFRFAVLKLLQKNYEQKQSTSFSELYVHGQDTSAISKHVGEREYAVHENQKLQEEMGLLRETRSSQQQGFSLVFVLLVFMSSVFVGHLMNGIKV